MLIGVAASATTIVLPTDEQLIVKSPVIVTATVLQSNPVQIGNRIWTETTLSIDHTYKGDVSGQLTVRELGGQIGDNVTKIFGAPEYTPGERVLAFLTPTPRGDYQTVDLFAGKFSEERTLAGGRVWLRDEARADVALVDREFQPVAAHNVQREANGFEKFVTDRIAGREGVKMYAIENPLLERDFNKSAGRIEANFTLISEPDVYRWFAFDRGQSVPWYSYGTQPGYSGGGVTEVQTAMSAWTGYSAALIRYAYAGVGSGAPANSNTNNGINEIEFNDPNQEIAGSWDGRSGVVGEGGFNGVSRQQSWTSTFTADASHVQGTFNAWEITEAFFMVQDGVSPNSGIPSQTLAEICAHEFGHTLGLGHSTDSTALMYPSVTGLGPSLRGDDQVAARWLYPNGSGSSTPPPPPPTAIVPASPSNVTATATGTNINVTWRDNASNETGQYVYVAAGSGAFTRVGDAGANATSATLTGASAGTYRVYVTAYNTAGESAPSNTATVNVSGTTNPPPAPAPVAAFAVSPNSGTAGTTTFIFTDQSTGSITSRSWNFGDGATSTLTNPVHVYFSAGTYTIVLTVSGSGGSSQATRTVSVTNPTPATPPVSAAFDFSPSSPNVGDAVTFTDRSSGSPTSWSWSFGDGTASNAQNPVHAYAGPGTYTINVTIFNSVSSSAASRTITVNAFAPYHSLVSASAQTNGANGSSWRTELTLFNSGSEAATGQYVFLPGAGGSAITMPLYIAPKQSITFENALQDIFGMSAGAGAIAIDASSAASTPALKITSRTYTGAST
ncbi:MAG TPA: PKD domain-containing protein, partial [Thermoanaerobaculia bacterium]|nr:PKD domain-containing protein [Thermoanaerobaculia bacterium]